MAMSIPKRMLPQEALKGLKAKFNSKQLMEMENSYAAKNYAPLPVVFEKALGVHVWDPEGNRYFDFLSAYSATNQGHNHPRIVAAMKKQLDNCALSSRAYFNSQFPLYAKFVTEVTGYDRLMPANSGAEANEVALKMARKWAYKVKGVPSNEAIIVGAQGNFHGRTISIISASDDHDAFADYGPFTPGFENIPYDDIPALEKIFKEKGDRICTYWVEPIQGEAGVFVPKDGYLRRVQELCKEYNVLLLADEVQTGFGRTGKLFCSDYDNIKPDAIIMGKALSGGLYPVSGVIADKEIMDVFAPGTHGSTFAGSPIAAVVGIEAISVLLEENLVENSYNLGFKFRDTMSEWSKDKTDVVKIVRGRGLLNAIAVDEKLDNGKFAYRWCIKMCARGILAKPTHGNIIRFSPPLTITAEQLEECMHLIQAAYDDAIAEI